MITVKISGGLGNQLSAYSFGYCLSKLRGEELVLDVSDYDNGFCRPYSLDALNIPEHRKVTYKQVTLDQRGYPTPPPALLKKYSVILREAPEMKTLADADEMLGSSSDSYITGYWNNTDYIHGYEDDIRAMFTPVKQSSRLRKFLSLIENQISVAVHVRLTDFRLVKAVLSMDYYTAAIAYVQSIHPDAVFYFFSDDIQSVKESLGERENFRYVTLFGGMDADLDEFFCISACTHCVMSKSSSYSAWTRRLNGGGMNVVNYFEDASPASVVSTIPLNDGDVKKWKDIYDRTIVNGREKKDLTGIESAVAKYIAEKDHESALNLLDDISFDAYGVDKNFYERFLFHYGMACMQAQNPQAAEQCFYRQKQFSAGKADFHCNFFHALKQLKKHPESAVHAGMVAKLSGDAALKARLRDNFKVMPPQVRQALLRLFDAAADIPQKHFIFCPLSIWTYYISYWQSLAAILAMMGHKVTMIRPNMESFIAISDISELAKLAQERLADKTTLDALYSYGIDFYPSATVEISGELYSTMPGVIQQLAVKNGIPTTVIVRNSDALQHVIKNESLKYISWECDPSDTEGLLVAAQEQGYLEYIFQRTHKSVFVSSETFNKFSKIDRNKCLLFKSSQAKPKEKFKYVSGRYGFTPNYISSQELFELAAFMARI